MRNRFGFHGRLGLAALLALLALGGGLIAASGPAAAEEAVARTAVNVRAGPGVRYRVVDVLERGERVEIVNCRPRWCRIRHPGPDGWVSARYLAPVADRLPEGRDCRFELVIGSDGPRFAIVCGEDVPAPLPPETDTPAEDEACFYARPGYRQRLFCQAWGRRDRLPSWADDVISSLRLGRNAQARLCTDRRLRGRCRIYRHDVADLGPAMDDGASSLAVEPRRPAPPPPTPPVHRRGVKMLAPGERIDLDSGLVGRPGADLWYRPRRGALPARLVPVDGARLALGDGRARGYEGCRDEIYSAAPVFVRRLAPGRYLCVRTGAGRFAEVRIDRILPGALWVRFVTWVR